MQKYDYLNRLIKTNCVVVVRGNDAAEAVKTVDAVIAGGITGIELTFTVPHADRVLDQLSEKYGDRADVLIGAGTVLDPATARLAIIAGAKFIVSPSFNADVANSIYSRLPHPNRNSNRTRSRRGSRQNLPRQRCWSGHDQSTPRPIPTTSRHANRRCITE